MSIVAHAMTTGAVTAGPGVVVSEIGFLAVHLQVAVTVATIATIREPGCIPVVNRRGVITDGMTIATGEGQVGLR